MVKYGKNDLYRISHYVIRKDYIKMMKLIIKFLLSFFLAIPHFLNAQSQHIWYFGNMAGLDFNVTPPIPITSGLNAQEGTATTCSNDGALLFYSNGATIWDRQHQVMPNGTDLVGGASSAQAALIVPLPGSCQIYYMFNTEDHFTDGGLAYSIIDMCLHAGLGDVVSTSKNILLENRTAENLTAVLHANGKDIWILAHKLGTNEFLAYLLTANGLNTIPVKSLVGSTYPSDAHIGCIKANQQGDKIVSVASFRNIYELFDFNTATGAFSNAVDLKPIIGSGRFVYGISFSPNDSLLYLSTFFVSSDLIQLDLHSMQQTTLQAIPGHYHLGALQLGPDEKIYLARTNQSFVDVIHAPDVPGFGCTYDPGGQPLLPGTTSQLGFPNIIPYALMPTLDIPDLLPGDTMICADDSIEISISVGTHCNATYLWEDGTTSAEKSISIPGLYQVEIFTSCGNFTDSMMVSEIPPISIMIPDEMICDGDTLIPDIEIQGVQYVWSDHTSNTYYQPNYTGNHWLQIADACSTYIDSFYITLLYAPSVGLPDSVFCQGDTLVFILPQTDDEILWSSGETDYSMDITEAGHYWVSLTNLCGTTFDQFTITENEKPGVQLTDSVICDGQEVVLNVYNPASSYIWSDQSMDPVLTVTMAGTYWVVVKNECGIDSAGMTLVLKNCDFKIGLPNVFSPNGDGINDFIKPSLSRDITSYEFRIFDRWGNNVYLSQDPSDQWDGRFRDKDCAIGVYTATLKCTSVDGIEKLLKGDITLLR